MWLLDTPVAHRGLHNDKLTENSMGAFQNAIDHGYIIETDVHLLKSGEVVVFHDNTLKRVCGIDVKISDLTLEDIKGNNYLLPSGEHIPLFSEMLELVNGQVGILLELKFNGLGNYKLEEEVLKLIKGKESWIAVQAFNPYTIQWFQKNAPEFKRGLLSLSALCIDVFLHWKKMQPDFISFQIAGVGLIKNYVKKRGAALLVWTIRTKENLAAAISNEVNNIIFEKVDLAANDFSMDKLAKKAD